MEITEKRNINKRKDFGGNKRMSQKIHNSITMKYKSKGFKQKGMN